MKNRVRGCSIPSESVIIVLLVKIKWLFTGKLKFYQKSWGTERCEQGIF